MDLSYQRFRRVLSVRNFFLAIPRILGFSYYFKSARASSIRSLWVDLSMVENGGGKCKNSSFRRIRRFGGISSTLARLGTLARLVSEAQVVKHLYLYAVRHGGMFIRSCKRISAIKAFLVKVLPFPSYCTQQMRFSALPFPCHPVACNSVPQLD
jgi:hypothetical protein